MCGGSGGESCLSTQEIQPWLCTLKKTKLAELLPRCLRGVLEKSEPVWTLILDSMHLAANHRLPFNKSTLIVVSNFSWDCHACWNQVLPARNSRKSSGVGFEKRAALVSAPFFNLSALISPRTERCFHVPSAPEGFQPPKHPLLRSP